MNEEKEEREMARGEGLQNLGDVAEEGALTGFSQRGLTQGSLRRVYETLQSGTDKGERET